MAKIKNLKVGMLVKWADPSITDYPRAEQKAMRNRTFIIQEINGTDEDSVIYIKDMSSSTEVEVWASELKIIKHQMRDMPIITEPTFRYHILPDNSMVDVYDVRYDCKVDIYNKKFISIFDADYAKSTLPTINDLVAMGIMGKEGTCIENEYKVYLGNRHSLNNADIDKIIAEFKANGFNVTKDAILHNFDAWKYDMKSGYRDDENGYHLFTPCGCNPLSFSATTLHKMCDDWQDTYEC